MGLITRPTKLGGGGDVIAGNDILASEYNGDINTIYTLVNGNLENINIKAGAAIVGDKLADAPNGVSAAKLNTDAVETAKIKNDAVTTAKILDANVTAAKLAAGAALANLAAASVAKDKLKIIIHTQSVSIVSTVAGSYQQTVTPSGGSAPFAKANYDLIGIFLKDFGSGDEVKINNIDITADDSGTNWIGSVHVTTNGTVTVDITAVFIFISKT